MGKLTNDIKDIAHQTKRYVGAKGEQKEAEMKIKANKEQRKANKKQLEANLDSKKKY